MTILLDVIIAFVVIEAAVVAWRRYARGEAGEVPADLANLGSGFCLMLAVRLAWTQSSAFLVILLVTLAGVSHVFDMMRRVRSSGPAKEKASGLGAPLEASDSEPRY